VQRSEKSLTDPLVFRCTNRCPLDRNTTILTRVLERRTREFPGIIDQHRTRDTVGRPLTPNIRESFVDVLLWSDHPAKTGHGRFDAWRRVTEHVGKRVS